MQLEKNISQLLYCHDCVIVPEFGGFVANYRSATIDPVRQIAHPPSKEISFNKQLQRNDGLLLDHVAETENIGHPEANTIIAKHVATWQETLSEGRRLELKGLGGLYFDKWNKLQFDPERHNEHLTSAFGMTAVQLPELRTTEQEQKVPGPAVVVNIDRVEKSQTEEKEEPVSLWPAAAASVVLLLAFGLWLNGRTGFANKGMSQSSGLNPFKEAPTPKYNTYSLQGLDLKADVETELEHPQGLDYFRYSFEDHQVGEEGAVVAWNVPEMAEAVNTMVATPKPSERFHVVGGCFREESNAIGLIQKLGALGYDPKLVDQHRGLFRVAVGSYQSKQQALRALAAVRKEHTPSAWLLVK